MKIKHLLIVAILSVFAFTSCEDNKKKEQEEKMEMERMEAEEEATREADMKMEQEKMEMQSNSIAAKAMATADLSTLVSALQSAELATMMKEDEGPFTVFAPSNDAFAKVPKATLDNLMMKENQSDLQAVLKYHVVSGEITSTDLAKAIKDNNGTYKFKTVEGAELTAMMSGDKIMLKDGNGKTATVIQADVDASNGVVHVIDAVVMKKS
ncbi:fasciclin domain-containing protein [Gillisia hiemivivida]|uniref:Fasciclin domain-containing protein n=1 Tax=Gillisia hiemivivida TaxID=291190 RepID=A0A5C6ZWV7_9FLAO|nr:fasciclin domain-containing protein [Gillisia hiemivivida]TXD93384.1 fasciclin domain-containing protein [Gillisia hiemivivida]